jgi:hypothetical protein
MEPRDTQFTFDCVDPARQATFWAEALGYRLQDPPPGFDSWVEALEARRSDSLGTNRHRRWAPATS